MQEQAGAAAPRIITIAGCKGGVGKSIIASGIALELGKRGKDVVIIDADLGGPNLHTYLGIQSPRYVISDFLSRRVKNLADIALKTDFPGVRFISSAGNVPGQANPRFAQKIKIIKSISSLTADFIIIDIGAGSSYDVMDFFSMTENGILVTVPEPTSIVNSYGFVKNVLYRRFSRKFREYPLVMELLKRGMNPNGDGGISGTRELMAELLRVNTDCWLTAKTMLSAFRPNIIVNMTSSENDIKLGYKLKAIITKYLSINAVFLGQVDEDRAVRIAAKKMVPFPILTPDSKAVRCINQIVQTLLQPRAEEADSIGIGQPENVSTTGHNYDGRT
jgi:flagellar biosynthesis protein FlhG